MTKSLRWRMLIILASMLVGIVLLLPTLVGKDELPEWWGNLFSDKELKLGLDLQGGAHFLLGVEAEEAIFNTADRFIEDLEMQLEEKKVKYIEIGRLDEKSSEIAVVLRNDADADIFDTLLSEGGGLGELSTISRTTGSAGEVKFLLDFTQDRKAFIRENAVKQARETIENRVNQFGMAESIVQLHGDNAILVQLPGFDDIEKAKELIGMTAQLSFQMLDYENTIADVKAKGAPRDVELLKQRVDDPSTEDGYRTEDILVKKKVLLTGESVKDANTRLDSQNGEVTVILEFDSRGSDKFAEITGANVNRQLAIVLDGVVYSAPRINERIGGGSARITGNFSIPEADKLAIVLKSGALPASITFLEQRTVSATLGADLIDKGKRSLLIGGFVVIAFMLVYYKFAGLIANLALVLNIFLLFAGLAAFGATLTLPGLAGIILTIGMAVDANVLIFERVREEKRLGKKIGASINAGFGKAWSSIIDANITTLITGLILFQFGTGPVKGFAVTLCLGILASLFTSVFVSRVIFDFILEKKLIKEISI